MSMFEKPSFLVQLGHNGHKLTESLLEDGHADGAILSPADYTRGKNKEMAQVFADFGGTVLFDPQYYIPRTDRPGLDTYPYFKKYGGDDFDTSGVRGEYANLCDEIISVQDEMGVAAYISPARFLDTFSNAKLDEWEEMNREFLKRAQSADRDIPVFASLPLLSTSMVDAQQRKALLNRVTRLDVDGFYVSVEFDGDNRFPLTKASNVYSFLELLLTLKKNRYEVLVGHTHQIAHLFFGIGVDAFASGHYQNLRAFDTRRWDPHDEQGGGRLVVKYYSEEILNELRVDPEMDLMYQKDDFDLTEIRTESPFDSALFDPSLPPSAAGWTFREEAWDHYIWCCNQIAMKYRGLTDEERFETAMETIESAESKFEEIIDKIGVLSEPERAIYSDWSNALQLIESDL